MQNLLDMAHSFVQQNVKLMSLTWHMRFLTFSCLTYEKCLVDMLILSFMKQNNNINKMTNND
jgi:hypothetical protein